MANNQNDRLNPGQRRFLLAFAQAIIPSGRKIPGASEKTLERFERFMATADPGVLLAFGGGIRLLQASSVIQCGTAFEQCSQAIQEQLVQNWADDPFLLRIILRMVSLPLKTLHLHDPQIHEFFGSRYSPEPILGDQLPVYFKNVKHLPEFGEDLQLRAEVVVVGTGAGGAVVARELAAKGHAVIMLEEGKYFRRPDFAASQTEKVNKLYRLSGMLMSLGNTPIALQLGKCVGGTTTINSGTCYRPAEEVLRVWREELGLSMFTPKHLEPYYQRVENILEVTRAAEKNLGSIAQIIRRGCEILGYAHEPVPRNAPDCDAQAHCQFGCPTDAKRSTNVSYVPMALKSHAMLITGARVTRVLSQNGQACGVQAEAILPDGGIRRLRIHCPVVVISCGALLTPNLLRQSGLCRRSKQLGKNLSLHPSSAVFALFDQTVRGWEGIPQGYAVTEFSSRGITLEGSSLGIEMAPIILPMVGKNYTALLESLDRMAVFGFMIQDESRGSVLPGRTDLPRIIYNLCSRDLEKIKQGKEILVRIFLAAGAKQVYTGLPGVAPIEDELGLAKFRQMKFSPNQYELAAFHPLGTARIGTSIKNSVTGHDHETHEVRNLFVVDGSSVPTSLGVNPQVLIMALATRAAEFIAEKIP